MYHFSAAAAALIADTDYNNDGVPYVSLSNKSLKISGLCLADGSEVILDMEQANLLNSQGINTAINMNGWKAWGNRTACYPGNTDIKDCADAAECTTGGPTSLFCPIFLKWMTRSTRD